MAAPKRPASNGNGAQLLSDAEYKAKLAQTVCMAEEQFRRGSITQDKFAELSEAYQLYFETIPEATTSDERKTFLQRFLKLIS